MIPSMVVELLLSYYMIWMWKHVPNQHNMYFVLCSQTISSFSGIKCNHKATIEGDNKSNNCTFSHSGNWKWKLFLCKDYMVSLYLWNAWTAWFCECLYIEQHKLWGDQRALHNVVILLRTGNASLIEVLWLVHTFWAKNMYRQPSHNQVRGQLEMRLL